MSASLTDQCVGESHTLTHTQREIVWEGARAKWTFPLVLTLWPLNLRIQHWMVATACAP